MGDDAPPFRDAERARQGDERRDPFDQRRTRLAGIGVARLAVRRHVEGVDAQALAEAGEDQRLEEFGLRVPAMHGEDGRTVHRARGNADQAAERQIELQTLESSSRRPCGAPAGTGVQKRSNAVGSGSVLYPPEPSRRRCREIC